MIATVSVLMVAHFAEVLVWSLTYVIVVEAPTDTDLIYFAFVNYTTLGYGDVTPVERCHLLGPSLPDEQTFPESVSMSQRCPGALTDMSRDI
jgi:hypothetical protein